MSHYDAAIIGGGPAGSTAATVLAKAGLKTVVLEREKFPRFHIGESLLPLNQELFDSLGLDAILKDQKFVLKYGAQFVSNEGSVERAFDFFQGGLGQDTFAYEVERETFDHLLLKHAAAQGAEVREETNVLEVDTHADRPCVLRVRTGGVDSTIEAKAIIDASGQSSLLAKIHDLRVRHASLQKMAVFARYKGGVRREGRKEGNIDIVLGAGVWFWIIPLRDDILSIGCVVNIADWKATGLSPEQFFLKAVESSPYVASRLQPGIRQEGFYTASNYSYSSRRFAGDGYLLAGDAAEFLDPIFSTGVILAMRSGQLAGRTLADTLRAGRAPRAAEFVSYETSFRRWTRNHFAMIDAFYGPGFGNVFLTPKNTLGMVKAVIALLAGKSEPSLLDRMRLKLFYWLIRMNNKHRWIPDPRPAESAVPHG
ncbi:MAG TPA: NAD(P)/FAD-dependent oxidoreductase [Planctomycetota bacterium]|nr:NAD(P)/FAD-dependent oxidoreductase [Planctomycetota bacterium]